MTDLLIRGATVIDGTGTPGIRASVAVDRGRIASILTDGGRPEADRILDADGLVLAPGFIDMHSHADFTLPSYPGAINSLAQGVTTEVLGNCGYSPAPLAGRSGSGRRAAGGVSRSRSGPRLVVADVRRVPRNGSTWPGRPSTSSRSSATACSGWPSSVPRNAPRPRSELDRMRDAATQALADGAWGMSTGLVYPPGAYANTDEIVAVGAGLPAVGGLYASHIRNENDDLIAAHRGSDRDRPPTRRPGRGLPPQVGRAYGTTVEPPRRWQSSPRPAPRVCRSTTTPIRTRPAARS